MIITRRGARDRRLRLPRVPPLVLRCEVEIQRDVDVVVDFAMALVARYSGTGPQYEPAREAFRAQAPKRVALEFVERDRVTWDHRKLGGTY